jgi:hypothetical protein
MEDAVADEEDVPDEDITNEAGFPKLFPVEKIRELFGREYWRYLDSRARMRRAHVFFRLDLPQERIIGYRNPVGLGTWSALAASANADEQPLLPQRRLFPVEKIRELFGPDYKQYLNSSAQSPLFLDLPGGDPSEYVVFGTDWPPSPPITLGPQAAARDKEDEDGRLWLRHPLRAARNWSQGRRQDRQPKPRIGSTAVHPVTGNTLRARITIMLVVAVIATVAWCMIAGKAPGEMTQYVAPISSLASLALGYWFGTEKKP